MSLADRCTSSFDRNAKSRGQTYFGQGSVDIDSHQADGLSSIVVGSGGVYTTNIGWRQIDRGEISVFCSCPRFAGGHLCKHIWATLLEMDATGIGEEIPGQGVLDVVDDMESAFTDDQRFDNFDDTFQAALMPPGSVSRRSEKANGKGARHKPQWQQQLSSIQGDARQSRGRSGAAWESQSRKRREVWYVLDVSASAANGSLVIEFFQRETKKNGEFGKLKRLNVHQDRISTLTDSQDRQLIQIMLGNTARPPSPYNTSYNGWQSYSYCNVVPAMYELLLPQLCATGRFAWLLNTSLAIEESRLLKWDDGEPWQFQLLFNEDKARKHWKISGRLTRRNQNRRLEDVVMVHDGVLLLVDSLTRFSNAEDASWIRAFLERPSIEVPFADRDKLLDQLSLMAHVPEADLPPGLRVTRQVEKPTGRIAINAPKEFYDRKQMYAKVGFAYNDHTFSLNDSRNGCFDRENDCLVKRDRKAESGLLAKLREYGVRPTSSYMSREADVQFHHRQFVDLVRELTNEGWIVESEGVRIRQPGSFNLSVTSDVDWFELDGQIDFDGVTASLPALLRALRGGRNYVRLDDGSQGVLPEKWLEKYGRLAELADADGDSLRFAASQALLLDALLAEQENVQVDRKFTEFRRKLRSFDGIEPRNEPRGFHGQLRAYQREGVGWLHFLREFNFGGCLADDMGLGKTIQVLALLQSRRMRRVPKDNNRTPSIVVVPKSLIFNWMEEAERFTPSLRLLNYTGLERASLLNDLEDYDVLLTTYGTLRRDIVKLKDIQFDYAILDESQAIKNHQSQAAKACRLLKAEHRLAMTGTPVENHLGELWSLFEFLNPGMLGRSTAFAAMSKNGRNGDSDAVPLLAHSLRPFILRRTKEQVLTELPEKTEQTLHCEMSPKQRKQYNELRDYYRAQLTKQVAQHGIQKSKIHVLEALLRLRQAACHPGLLDEKKIDESSAKLEALLEQVKEVTAEGHKALVFSQFTSLLSIVRKHLDKEKVVYEYLDGRTRKRGEKVKRFQNDPDCPLFLISLKAGGHGLNLTAADYVFILDPWWNPAVEAQAVDRAHRIGQTRRVFAYRLICQDTVEEKILELQRDKRQLADAIVSADNNLIRNLTTDDLQLLLS